MDSPKGQLRELKKMLEANDVDNGDPLDKLANDQYRIQYKEHAMDEQENNEEDPPNKEQKSSQK